MKLISSGMSLPVYLHRITGGNSAFLFVVASSYQSTLQFTCRSRMDVLRFYLKMESNGPPSTTSGDCSSEMEVKGIPKAVFMEDVGAYLKANNFSTLMEAGRAFEELHQKYQIIERALLQRKIRLMQQLPDIQKTLAVVRQLKKKNTDLDVTFEVSNQLFARAHIPKADRVGLWLGANVMLEYDLEEAEKILVENEDSAKQSLADVDRTLEFLKEQTTTVEVNLARLHNLSVKQGRQNKAAMGTA